MQQKKIKFRGIEVCPSCNHEFEKNNRKQPRMLICGHDICSKCVKNSVLQNGLLKCSTCGIQYSKQTCSNLQINQFYLDLIQCVEINFGKYFYFEETQSEPIHKKQAPLGNRNVENQLQQFPNGNQMGQQLMKCKNSPCFNKTDLIFCSSDCRAQFEEVQTKKNDSFDPNRQSTGFSFDI